MSQTQLIMIDDTDHAITYTGNWIADKGRVDTMGNYGAPYMSTNHYIKGTGSFTFTFSGTYVGVFGTTLDSTDPSRTCTVDGSIIPNNHLTSAENMVMHCQVSGLADGKHTLVVTVPTPNTNGYWFDYLMYIPSASVSRDNAVLNIINGDPSMSLGPGWSNQHPGFIATTNGATFTMPFTGRSLTWLGYYFSQNKFAATTATWSVDGSTPISFPLNGIESQSTGAVFNQRFFTTGILPAGTHTLKVVYNGNSDTTPLSIYQVFVQNGDTAGASVGGIIAGGGSPGGTSGVANGVSSSSGRGTAGSVSPPGTVSGSTVHPNGSFSTITVTSGTATVTGTTKAQNASSTVEVIGTGSQAYTVTVADGIPTLTSSTIPFQSAINGTLPSSNSGSSASVHAPSHHLHPAILVAVFGILAIFTLILVMILIRHRRRTTVQDRPTVIPFVSTPSEVALVFHDGNTRGNSRDMERNSEAHSSPRDRRHVSPYRDEKQDSTETSDLDSVSFYAPTPSVAGTSSHRPDSSSVILHQDSGVRLPRALGGRSVVEMPPTYSEA